VWRITATDREGREVARLELEAGDLSIGRDNDRQLVLPAPSVSRRHCRLRIDHNGPVIMDEGSANGVIVNGIRITAPTPVNQMSRIEVAEFRIAVEPLAPPRAAVPGMPDPSMGMVIPQQMGMPQPAPGVASGYMPMPGPGPAPGPADVVRLIAEGGPYDGRVFELPNMPEIAVGRAVDNDVVLDDPSLSRKHAKLRRLGAGRLDVEDANSANGTYINGRKITRAQLGPGDTLRFGELIFRIDGGGLTPPPRVPGAARAEGASANVKLAFFGMLALTVIVYGGWVWAWRSGSSGPPKGSVEKAISDHIHAVEPQVRGAQEAINKQDWALARRLAEKALDVDPANLEAARLKSQAVRAEDDQQKYKQGVADIEKGSSESLQSGLRMFHAMSPDSPYREDFAKKLTEKLQGAGREMCRRKSFRECASLWCDAYRVAPASQKPNADFIQKLRDAEKRARMVTGCVLK
jgi:pSer/pThr/pTyr-binding forkhead associated (FHA) protein